FDSVWHYKTEGPLVKVVRESGVPREQIFCTLKSFDSDHGYGSTLEAVQDYYLDLFLIHSPHLGKTRHLQMYKVLLRAKKEGKLKSAGVKLVLLKHFEEVRDAGLKLLAVNQIELHPFCQQKSIVDYCRANGIAVRTFSLLVRGKLDNPAITSVSSNLFSFTTIKTPAQIATRWNFRAQTDSATVYCRFVPLLRCVVANAEVFDYEITEENMKNLDALDKGMADAIACNPVDAAEDIGGVPTNYMELWAWRTQGTRLYGRSSRAYSCIQEY
ncbi:Aldo/keto reductase, partial [Heliocybe sulcata]